MQFGSPGAVALVLHERHSRLMMAVRLPSKEAGPVVKAMARLLGPLPPEFRQTVTFDNGTEFVRHHCTPWGSKRSSATRTRRGRRGAWRMGSVGWSRAAPEDEPGRDV